MRAIIIKLLLNTGGFYLASIFFPRITFSSPALLLWSGLVLGLVNILVRPVLLLLTLPVNLLTFGIFTLVINTLMVMLTGTLVRNLHIPGFWHALAIAVIISGLNMLLFD